MRFSRPQEQRYSRLTTRSLRLWLSGYYTDKDLVKRVTALTGARKAAMAAGGVVALGAAAILLPNANASQDGGGSPDAAAPRTLKAADASDLASQLAGQLGDAFAGSYYDAGAQRLVVNVVPGDDDQVAVRAQRAGAAEGANKSKSNGSPSWLALARRRIPRRMLALARE